MTRDVLIENKNFYELNPLVCGEEACAKSHSFGPSARSYYIIHYIISGSGILKKDNEIYKINKGHSFLIKPNEVITYTADPITPWHYIWIGFDGNLSKAFDQIKDPVIIKDLSIFQELSECLLISSTREEFLVGKLFEIYSILFDSNKNDNYVSRAKNYMKSNYMNHIMIEDIASMIGLDRRYLSRIFKEKYNLSMKEYLMKIRMTKAIELLKKGYHVSEVSTMIGYSDPLTFSKLFKKYYTVSPSYYKFV